MKRRWFMHLVAASAFAPACAARAPAHAPSRSGPIRAVAFDLFTLFDPRGVDRRVAAVAGEHPTFAASWKSRLFEYAFIRAAAGRYADFRSLVRDSLAATERGQGLELSNAQRDDLERAFTELDLWPDAETTLQALRARGLRLAPLANYAPSMIDALLEHAGIGHLFDARISTDQARTYKPDPEAYRLAETTFHLPRAQIAFSAFGAWDAAGGAWFGFPTYWVNRLAAAAEALTPAAASGRDLAGFADWVDERSREGASR